MQSEDDLLSNSAHKEILKDDYEKHRNLAEKNRETDNPEKAAKHYNKCAKILKDISEMENSKEVKKEQLKLAKNLKKASKSLKESGSIKTETPKEKKDKTDRKRKKKRTSKRTSSKKQSQTTKDSPNASEYLSEPPETDFDDVGGMVELKETLKDKVIDPLERPELYEKYNLGVVNGILLHGPPGTGKTYITKALAGKLDYNFIEVSPTDLTSSLVGQAADNVAELFQVAKNNQPCLLFIDELDAIASKRSGGAQKTQSERQMINQMLEEMTDIQGEDVIVVGATNLLKEIDDAIKRSGRFDERIEVPAPDGKAREAILRIHLRDRPVLSEKLDWKEIKSKTKGYSASDMELVARNAARKALKNARDKEELQQITQKHINEAIKETESSLKNWRR